MSKCGVKCEIFSRVVGYHRPINAWNKGKKSEEKERKVFNTETSFASEYGKKVVVD